MKVLSTTAESGGEWLTCYLVSQNGCWPPLRLIAGQWWRPQRDELSHSIQRTRGTSTQSPSSMPAALARHLLHWRSSTTIVSSNGSATIAQPRNFCILHTQSFSLVLICSLYWGQVIKGTCANNASLVSVDLTPGSNDEAKARITGTFWGAWVCAGMDNTCKSNGECFPFHLFTWAQALLQSERIRSFIGLSVMS